MDNMNELILQAINEFATEAIQVVDAEGNYIFCNQAFTSITGVPVSQRLGSNVKDVQADGACAQVLKTGRPVYGHINSAKDGVIMLANAAPIRARSGELLGVISVFNDRSSYIKLVQNLKKSEEEIRRLKKNFRELNRAAYSFSDLIGDHPVFRVCLEQAKGAADSDASVLITGESGTGKELFAQAIHNYSRRSEGPMIRVNCPAIPATLIESELFGYEKGAFTGAQRDKPGKFELAQGGTIFLDEIGDLELTLQAKLLRVLQEHEIERIGGTHTIPLDVRVISATNQNLDNQISERSFRQDLYYRLNVIHIEIPPLRQRKSDIPLLLGHMLEKHCASVRPRTISKEAMRVFMDYDWPGNVRELENAAERLLLCHGEQEISKNDALLILKDRRSSDIWAASEGLTLSQLESLAIQRALERHGTTWEGKKAAAAELGISLSGLYKKIQKIKTDSPASKELTMKRPPQ